MKIDVYFRRNECVKIENLDDDEIVLPLNRLFLLLDEKYKLFWYDEDEVSLKGEYLFCPSRRNRKKEEEEEIKIILLPTEREIHYSHSDSCFVFAKYQEFTGRIEKIFFYNLDDLELNKYFFDINGKILHSIKIEYSSEKKENGLYSIKRIQDIQIVEHKKGNNFQIKQTLHMNGECKVSDIVLNDLENFSRGEEEYVLIDLL